MEREGGRGGGTEPLLGFGRWEARRPTPPRSRRVEGLGGARGRKDSDAPLEREERSHSSHRQQREQTSQREEARAWSDRLGHGERGSERLGHGEGGGEGGRGGGVGIAVRLLVPSAARRRARCPSRWSRQRGGLAPAIETRIWRATPCRQGGGPEPLLRPELGGPVRSQRREEAGSMASKDAESTHPSHPIRVLPSESSHPSPPIHPRAHRLPPV